MRQRVHITMTFDSNESSENLSSILADVVSDMRDGDPGSIEQGNIIAKYSIEYVVESQKKKKRNR